MVHILPGCQGTVCSVLKEVPQLSCSSRGSARICLRTTSVYSVRWPTTMLNCTLFVIATTLSHVPVTSWPASKNCIPSAWRQIVWQWIQQRLTSYGVSHVINHPIHHLH